MMNLLIFSSVIFALKPATITGYRSCPFRNVDTINGGGTLIEQRLFTASMFGNVPRARTCRRLRIFDFEFNDDSVDLRNNIQLPMLKDCQSFGNLLLTHLKEPLPNHPRKSIEMSEQKRRAISFSSFEEVISDIETLASSEHETSGTHSFAKIVQHLATTNEMVVGKIIPPKLPWFMRMAMPFLKNGMLNNPVQPGFSLPNSAMQEFFWSSTEVDLNVAIENFRASVEAYNEKGPLPVHPVFGKASKEQVTKVTLSHAAMHLSFVHPK